MRALNYILMLALVLSGGGLFGAWQAGAWSVLAERMSPDLIVGASVGSLNGYLIASGITPEELRERWLEPKFAKLGDLKDNLRLMTSHYSPRTSYGLTVTDLFRLRPKTFRDGDITWRHLTASCALPLVLAPVRIDGRWYVDGGLLNGLPVWAAVEMGATRIVALHVIPEFPSALLKPVVKAFRFACGYNPPLPAGVELDVIYPSSLLGSARDALVWKRSNIERWLAQGEQDANRAVTEKTFSF